MCEFDGTRTVKFLFKSMNRTESICSRKNSGDMAVQANISFGLGGIVLKYILENGR